MTARDFTPTDEQIDALAASMYETEWEAFGDQWRDVQIDSDLHDLWISRAREALATPAFQSIIAAAKAEAWEEGATATAEHRSDFRAPGEWTEYNQRTGIRHWIATPEPTNPYRDPEASA